MQQSISSRHKPGYTGHEMLDAVGIIHMNGRLYDPELGRMMSPDPVIQSPGNSQNYAAYSYVFNNPMKLTDPSGYRAYGYFAGYWALAAMDRGDKVNGQDAFSFFLNNFSNAKPWTYMGAAYTILKIGGQDTYKQWQQTSKSVGWKTARNRLYKQWGLPEPHTPKKNWFRIFVTIVAAVALSFYGAPALGNLAGGGTAGAAASGAAVGASISASMTAIQGGSWGDILKSGLHGAVTGAISGAVNFQIGEAFKGTLNTMRYLEKAGIHGLFGGIMSTAEGGSFRDGFVGAAVGSLFGPILLNKLIPNRIIQGFGAAIVGGTASVLSGGKFANGAISAAFSHLYNDLEHQGESSSFTGGFKSTYTDAKASLEYAATNPISAYLYLLAATSPTGAFYSSLAALPGAWDFSMQLLDGNPAAWGRLTGDLSLLALTDGLGRAFSWLRGLGAAKSAPSFFEGATYTPKVLQQALRGAGEFHSFPAAVDAFESAGTIRTITGGDKDVRQVLEIPGSYMTPSSPGVPGRLYDGIFQYIKNPDNTINHRLFVPNP